ncbi:MAG TPA: DUF1552 domain-containing protein [Vicinamibacterales bacterium]|jgi:hypothetical protein|nr:DUF1552 domain-containing protein [Vicinamibacterales bacterium]
MFIAKKAFPRRTFLRGAGATLALPLLDAMVPAMSAATPPTPRLGYLYVPNGMHMPLWKPKAQGAGDAFELSQILQGLAPVKEHLTVLGGLNNYVAGLGDGGGPHTRNQSAWLSGTLAKMGEADVSLAETVDQHAARHLGKDTLLESLEICTDPSDQVGTCDNGYSCLYVNTISWKSATVPNPMERNPRVIFERLFGEESDAASRIARIKADRSILDDVLGDLSLMGLTLGAHDKLRIDEYLDAVRDVEKRIQKAEKQQAASPIPLMERPTGIPETFEEHTGLLFDLIYLAYRADLTRVATFSIAREQGNKNYTNIGVPEGHHECSHHQNDPHKQAQLTKINSYHIQLLNRFLEKMKNAPDGDGSLLDHSAIVYGAGQSDGDLHSPLDLPTLLLGKGCGKIKGNRYIDYAATAKTPFMNLHLALLDKAGVPTEHIGDSNGMLTDI